MFSSGSYFIALYTYRERLPDVCEHNVVIWIKLNQSLWSLKLIQQSHKKVPM